MPPKDIHHHGPTQARKNRPPIPDHCPPQLPIPKQLKPSSRPLNTTTRATSPNVSLLHRQLGERQTHARKDVDDNLLRNRVVYRAAKHGVSAQQASEEGVVVSLFARRRGVAQEYHAGFVDEREEAEVAGVLASRFVDEEAFGADGT